METRNLDFYMELKSKNPITDCALELNYSGKKQGSYWQGDCPAHGSKQGACLVIWPKIQAWKCFHCGEKGDVINLVMLFKRCDHKTAVAYLAKRAGITLWGGKELSPVEIAQREKDLKEKILLEDMLTATAHWFHEQLAKYPEIKDHLNNHYGFSDEIIEELKIGFAPPGENNPQITSELAKHLESIPGFKGKLALSSLFTTPSGPFRTYFRGRIIFPYWKGGKVVNMIARSTDLTPVDKYECYTEKDGVTVKKDAQGKPEYIKYKKLRTHIPDDEKRKHISRFINADAFMGEDSIRGEDEVIITEGAPDFVSAVDKGFACISPVTTNFRESDFEKLNILTRSAKHIFIINDNEDNLAGYIGALKTGKYLTEKGRNVFLVKLPMPQGSSKIDLNEYLKDHTAAELKAEMEKAKSVLQLLIDQLPPDFIKAQPNIREYVAPLLVDMDEGKLQHFIKLLTKKTGTTAKAIYAEIDSVKEAKRKKEAGVKKESEIQVDPEIEKAAAVLANEPLLFKKRLEVINEAGVVGERKTVAMYFCAMDSRLLPNTNGIPNPNVLAVKNAGHYGAGKSFTLTMCTQIYPEEAYFMITNGSAKSLYFLKGGLKHKCLIVTEGFQFQENNASDSELVYSIRSLISEGRVSYCVVEKDKNGDLVTMEKKLEGPTSFITTTVMDDLEPQLEDRLFTIHPDEGFEQTRDIITMTGLQRADLYKGLDKKTMDTWKQYHRSLKPVEVVIPFSPAISRFITKNTKVPLATRRAFNRVMIVIQSVACAYQYQRKKDGKGKIVAEMVDYWMALQIVREAFRENLSRRDKKTEERLLILEEKGPLTSKALAELLGVSAGAVSQWTTKKVDDKTLAWCDEFGEVITNEMELKKVKHTGKAYLKVADDYGPISVTGLPTPYELTNDSDWGIDGKLLRMYDLELDKRADLGQVFSGVKGAFSPPLNTPEGSEPVNSIEKSDIPDIGVKVFSRNQGNEDNRIDEGNDSSLLTRQATHDLVRATATKKEPIPNKKTDDLSVEFASIMGVEVRTIGKASMTPDVCRTGCKHYDGVKDVNDGEFKEFCCQRGMIKINEDQYCACFEGKGPKLPEGVLPM